MPFYGFGLDPTIIIVIPAIILALFAQSKVKNTFTKYSRIRNRRNLTGKEVAERMLQNAGLYDVRVEPIRGNLTDHYSPREKVLRLSDPVYNSTSVAALGVAAHECGHAIQHGRKYAFLMLRDAIVPVVNFSGKLAMPLVMLGLFIAYFASSSTGFAIGQFGILLFSIVVFFQLITLPVELNASKRATRILLDEGYLDEEEIVPAKKVLNAAALTYVAAAAVGIANLLRLLVLFGGRRD